jgi:hypothetical protein
MFKFPVKIYIDKKRGKSEIKIFWKNFEKLGVFITKQYYYEKNYKIN